MLFSQQCKWLFKKFLKKDRCISTDASGNKYILLRHGNILIIYIFAQGENTLKTIHDIDIKYGITKLKYSKDFF